MSKGRTGGEVWIWGGSREEGLGKDSKAGDA